MRILWGNFPIPEQFIIALLGGGLLQILIPIPIFVSFRYGFLLGLILIAIGIAAVFWAIIHAGDNELEFPTTLVTGGPYAISRNPMYLSWAMIHVGIAILVNTAWLVIAAALAMLYLNASTIPKEERLLLENFGGEYEAYRKRVRRWI